MTNCVRALCEQIALAARRVPGHLEATPVQRASYLETDGAIVFLKCERRQPAGSFKVRGAPERGRWERERCQSARP